MRVLCLHDEFSSASALSISLQKLEMRLFERHGIELDYINSPLVFKRAQPPIGVQQEQQEQRKQEQQEVKNKQDERIWYLDHDEFTGLDASLLNLRQIWSQGCYSGILGVGQGAAIAGILPLLHYQEMMNKEGGNDNLSSLPSSYEPMFEGLRFCIFLNGWDLMSTTPTRLTESESRMEENVSDCTVNKDENENGSKNKSITKGSASRMLQDANSTFCYEDVRHLSTLHMFYDDNESDSDKKNKQRKEKHKGQVLFERYGGKENSGWSDAKNNITNDNENPNSPSSSSLEAGSVSRRAQKYVLKKTKVQEEEDCALTLDARMCNILGKFIVDRKKEILAEKKQQQKQIKNGVSNSKTSGNMTGTIEECDIQAKTEEEHERKISSMDIETTRLRIAQLESEAISLMNSTIALDPPKALMAVIAPDGDSRHKVVGGWTGPKDAFRSEEFKISGGSPCPQDFALPLQERKKEDLESKQDTV